MPNRLTGLDFAAWTYVGTAYIGDVINAEVTVNNKTAEGKGIGDIDDYPIFTGRGTELTAKMIINSTGTVTKALNTFATGSSPAGTILITTGMGGGYAGTAVITQAKWAASREGLQEFDITLLTRGAFPFA